MKDKKNIIICLLVLVVLILGGIIIANKLANKNDDSTNSNAYSEKKEYNVGDEINFNNEKWHVISKSLISDDYVVVIKDEGLSELKSKAYYECPKEDDNGLNCNMKMSNDYKKSAIKSYFDNTYVNLLGKNNLKEVNGYYVRLITVDELVALGCNLDSESCLNAPSWLTSNFVSWTMSHTTTEPTDDASLAFVYSFGFNSYTGDNGIYKYGVGSTLNVRPVINLLKSSIK